MGGEHSGCGDDTTDVLLEVAYFDPPSIARTGQALALASDARGRFERGVDPAFLDTGMDLLTSLILEICGGEASEVIRAGEPPVARKTVVYDPALAESFGGIAVSRSAQFKILNGLGFPIGEFENDKFIEFIETEHDRPWVVKVPTWRPDVDGAPDIVEEVIRVHGLDAVPSTPLPRVDGVAKPTATPAQMLERRVRRAAAARGLHEAVTWSFLPETEAAHFADGEALWTLANPISEDLKTMRPSLLPGLLSAVKRNLDRGASSVRLFEVGRRYLRGANGASDEKLSLGVVLAGDKVARGWASGKAQVFDAFDAKAEAMALLAEAGAPVDSLQVMGETGPQFHPGQSATLRLGPKAVLARFGVLHPSTAKAFDIDGPVVVVELFLDRIPAKKGAGAFARPHFAPPPLQAVTRDFAFLVAAEVAAGDLLRSVKGADKANIVAARVFDDFRGAGVPEGQKSLAIEVTLQPVEKSYDEAALKAIADKVIAAAAKQGAQLRG
jgi:phenylalanyl-tRNA synthetase beta chain